MQAQLLPFRLAAYEKCTAQDLCDQGVFSKGSVVLAGCFCPLTLITDKTCTIQCPARLSGAEVIHGLRQQLLVPGSTQSVVAILQTADRPVSLASAAQRRRGHAR